MANSFYSQQEADGFNEGVDSYKPGHAFPLDWLPRETLCEFGLRPVIKNHHWVMTTGVEQHIDKIWGLTLIWVLVNDEMFFRQGREKVIHKPGEWFIFNDALSHGVDITKKSPQSAVYLGWAVQLETT